jgi:predicted ATPase/class 3 adenylate cyclase
MTLPRIPIPQEYAEKLKAARTGRTMQGERRVVTILFSDVKGSTAMAEDMDPEDWAEIMGQAFEYLIAPIYRYEGTLARLMGDAILAFFGAPLAHEDDPQRAILAGLEIIEGIKPFCERVRAERGLDFGVRVGINTGPVVVGDIGSDLAMEYTAMGDTVNVASRMEQTAQPGTVQIAEATYKLVGPLFEIESLAGIEIKGKKDPVQAYRVIRPKAQPGKLRGIEGLTSTLIGRAKELDQLSGTLEQLRQGRGGIVCLLGEAGLGKSRLIAELRQQWARQPGGWIQSGGVSYDMSRPYSIFQQLFLKLCGISAHEEPKAARELIEKLCQDFQPEVEQQAARAAELILTFHQEPSSPIPEGEALKRELFEVMLAAWRKPAVLPLVLVFDDLHWADTASIELLKHLFQLADEIPILFVCAMRPHRQSPGWQVKLHAETEFPHRFSEVSLEPLSDRESGELLNSLLIVSELPPALSELIRGKAEGNPFFVEELIRTLIDEGAIVRDESGSHWRAIGDVDAIAIPENLQALLVSRVDRLDKEVRRTVQLASVIGRSFYYRVLEWIAEASERLRDHLNVLQRVELIHEHARIPELEYVFKHDLTRDAAYESILRKERPQFHRQVGEAIEALFPDRLEEESHRLAYHYREAKDDEKALKYYTLAGNMARRLSAYSEAITQYSHALDIANEIGASPGQLSFLYTRRGRMYELAGRYDEALANYHTMQGQALKLDEPRLELSALNAQATIYAIPSGKWDPPQAEALATAALALARKLNDPRGEARAEWNLMLVENFSERDPEASVRHGERSLAIARQHGLTEEEAYATHDLARAYNMSGQYGKAAEALEQARRLWEQLGNSELLADNLTSSAFSSLLQGNLAQAIESAQRALEISRKTGNTWGQAYSLMCLGLAHIERGEISDGKLAFEESAIKAREANFSAAGSFVHSFLALTYYRLGDPQRALELIDLATRVVIEMDPTRLYPLGMKALILASRGETAEVHRLVGEFSAQMEGQSTNPEFLGFSSFLQSELLLADQQFDEVLDFVERRIAQLEAFGARYFVPQLTLSRGVALRKLGRLDESSAALDLARRAAQEIGLRLTLLLTLLETIELAEQVGDVQRANESRQATKEVIRFISDHIDEPALRASFQNLPQIRSVLAA